MRQQYSLLTPPALDRIITNAITCLNGVCLKNQIELILAPNASVTPLNSLFQSNLTESIH